MSELSQRIVELSGTYHRAEIARRVGVSTQYVWQVIHQEGITPVKAPPRPQMHPGRMDTVLRMHSEGHTRTEVAAALGISHPALCSWCLKYGLGHLKWVNGRGNRENIAAIKEMAKAGMTKAEIARKLGVAHNNIGRTAKRHYPDLVFADGRYKGRPPTINGKRI